MSTTNARFTRAAAAAILGLLAAGCSTQSQYTREGITLAEEKMSVIKAGTEWQMAHQAFLAGDLDKALKKVDASLSINDSVVKSHVLRGRILIEKGNLGRALESLLTAVTINPRDPDAHYFLGIVYERLDDAEQAADHYVQACELDGYNPSYAVAAAEMFIDLGRIDEARDYLNSDPMFEHDSGVRQALGHIAMIQGDPATGAKMFAEATLLAPNDTAILEDLARAQMATGAFADADQNLLRLLKEPTNKDRRDLRHSRARCLVELDRPVEARAIYQALLEGQDGLSDVDAWIGLGNIAFMINDFNALRRCASRIVAIAPARPDGYALWALWHRENNDSRQALAAIDRAIAANPSDPVNHAFRGVLLSDAGQHRAAIDAFTDAVTLDPGHTGFRTMLEHAEAGTFASVPTSTD